MKSFVKEIFLPKFYNKLGIRKDTMKLFFESLEKLNLEFYVIVETGTSRGGLSDLAGNGAATYLFDQFVNFYDGVVYSFDINEGSCNLVQTTTSNKCNVICIDSIRGIDELKYKNVVDIHGLYLDSYDTKFNDDQPSSEHALKELMHSLFYLNDKSVVLVDDTPSSVDLLPPWVKSDPNRYNNIEYMNSLHFPCGKGRQILNFVNASENFNVIEHDYQIVITKNISCDTIPKILHRTWKTKQIDYNIFAKTVVDSWEKHNPDFEFNIHSDEDNLNFISTYYPWFLEIYNSYPKEIFRADAVRYFYLLHYGGVYADLDVECMNYIFTDLTHNIHLVTNNKDWVSNAIMMSAPGHSFWKQVILNGLIKNKDVDNVLYSTGPAMISNVFYDQSVSFQQKCHLPASKYYPIKYYENFDEKYNVLNKDVVTVHHFAASWVK